MPQVTALLQVGGLEPYVQLRKERGWSQEQLALECGMARSYLGGVERGKRNIALLNICKLADALSVPPAEMLKLNND